jgi:hypothetical protein
VLQLLEVLVLFSIPLCSESLPAGGSLQEEPEPERSLLLQAIRLFTDARNVTRFPGASGERLPFHTHHIHIPTYSGSIPGSSSPPTFHPPGSPS